MAVSKIPTWIQSQALTTAELSMRYLRARHSAARRRIRPRIQLGKGDCGFQLRAPAGRVAKETATKVRKPSGMVTRPGWLKGTQALAAASEAENP